MGFAGIQGFPLLREIIRRFLSYRVHVSAAQGFSVTFSTPTFTLTNTAP